MNNPSIDTDKKWFVLRASYGRGQKACETLAQYNIEYYFPTHMVEQKKEDEIIKVRKPLIPSLVFVYSEEQILRPLLKQIPILSFYYNHFKEHPDGKNPPLTVPEKSMQNFILASKVYSKYSRIIPAERCHFKRGDLVEVIDGEFKGVVGRVARFAGQQRVVVELQGVCLFATGYIPTAFLKTIKGDLEATL